MSLIQSHENYDGGSSGSGNMGTANHPEMSNHQLSAAENSNLAGGSSGSSFVPFPSAPGSGNAGSSHLSTNDLMRNLGSQLDSTQKLVLELGRQIKELREQVRVY
jgi:hypothetical protein